MAVGAVGDEVWPAFVTHNGLSNDRARRIASTQEQNVVGIWHRLHSCEVQPVFASVAARRSATRLFRDWLRGPDERAEELSIHLRGNRVDIDSLPRQKFARIFRPADTRWFNVDLLQSGVCHLVAIVILF